MTIKKEFNWPAWISIFLTLIGFTIGAVVWANSTHVDIKTWTAERDYAIEKEIRDDAKEQYVPRHEFSRIQQQLEDQVKQLDRLDKKLDKVLERLH